MIQITHLTKSYGKARGITDLTLHVPEGSCFGFIGPNGAGKSTTIRTLLGLITPTAGSARVLGLDCARDRTAILTQVGYMPSEAMFYPEMRVSEVIRLSANLRKRDCREEAAGLCRALELDVHCLRHAAPAKAVRSGRAHQRPGPSGPAGLLVPGGPEEAGGGHGISLLPRAL